MSSSASNSGGNGDFAHRQEKPAESADDSHDDVDGIGGNTMSPKCGWRAEEDYGDDLHPGVRLNLTLFVGLEVFKRIEVWKGDNNHLDHGCMSRELVFWQAVAHYLNSGGNLEDSAQQLCDLLVSPTADGESLPVIAIPEGFILLQTQRIWFTDEDGARERVEHTYINQHTREAVRWIEDIEVRETSMQELLDELEEEEEPFDET